MANELPTSRFFGGIGLIDLAMRLAEQRGSKRFQTQDLDGYWSVYRQAPAPRYVVDLVSEDCCPVSREYYIIIDRISRGEKP